MLEFKHPNKLNSLSAMDFFRASTKDQTPSESKAESIKYGRSVSSSSSTRHKRTKSVTAACVVPTVIFLSTEMFTPAEEPARTVSVPDIVITAEDDGGVELPVD